MFGLMQSAPKDPNLIAAKNRNIHYCGVCKSLGSLYGNRYRPLLNVDTVFMAEFLTAIVGIKNDFWGVQSFKSVNCFNIPSKSEIPEILRFSAAATLVLTGLSLKDKLSEKKHPGLIAKTSNIFISSGYKDALQDIQFWGIDTDAIVKISESQIFIENNSLFEGRKYQSLEVYSNPTSSISGILFSGSAITISSEFLTESLKNLGELYGKLIYVIDAYEDYSKDLKNSNFNAIASAWNANDIEMPSQIRREVICYIHELKNKIVDLSEEFQMDEDVKTSFLHRLEENISLRLEGEFSDSWNNQLKQFEEDKSRSKLQVAILGARKFLSKDELGEKKNIRARKAGNYIRFSLIVAALYIFPLSSKQSLAFASDDDNAGGVICGIILVIAAISWVADMINKATRRTQYTLTKHTKKGACE